MWSIKSDLILSRDIANGLKVMMSVDEKGMASSLSGQ